jgi:acyl-CoA thioester hydrolase
MPRIRLQLPDQFSFETLLPVRITDLNYGGHVGNDAILSLIHEARMQFLAYHRYTELQLGGVSLIMSDAAIEFRAESFYGDVLKAEVTAGEFSRAGFELYYRLTQSKSGQIVAVAKTGMVCFDYTARKVAPLPEEVKARFSAR